MYCRPDQGGLLPQKSRTLPFLGIHLAARLLCTNAPVHVPRQKNTLRTPLSHGFSTGLAVAGSIFIAQASPR
jgi:hypothetical protein